jgi:hypothetical protein
MNNQTRKRALLQGTSAPAIVPKTWLVAKFILEQEKTGHCTSCVYSGVLERWPSLSFREYAEAMRLARSVATIPQGGNA